MSRAVTAKGRCLCGAVTYECSGEPLWAAYCHCKSCRLNTASPVTAYFGMANGKWRWTGETPANYKSRPDVCRYFCKNCGTPIAYESEKFRDEIHFYTAALEDDAGFEPRGHVHFSEHLSWFDTNDTLKRLPTTSQGDT